PGLTTVRQPMRELGEQSVRMLLGRITDQAAPRQSVILPTRTVIRRSCGCHPRPTGKGGVANPFAAASAGSPASGRGK
ncbi:MAG TPA: substrate-binding domain-containing protein, partial [Streptosporangiaceae bacterium]|nr:substrate-binding domain-containing protein [Streptosporangiaceae bacterium]